MIGATEKFDALNPEDKTAVLPIQTLDGVNVGVDAGNG